MHLLTVVESFSNNWMKPEEQIMRKIMVMQNIAPEV